MTETTDLTNAEHLGDGAYVLFNGWDYMVFTHNGLKAENVVYLEPSAMENLLDYVQRMKAK